MEKDKRKLQTCIHQICSEVHMEISFTLLLRKIKGHIVLHSQLKSDNDTVHCKRAALNLQPCRNIRKTSRVQKNEKTIQLVGLLKKIRKLTTNLLQPYHVFNNELNE